MLHTSKASTCVMIMDLRDARDYFQTAYWPRVLKFRYVG